MTSDDVDRPARLEQRGQCVGSASSRARNVLALCSATAPCSARPVDERDLVVAEVALPVSVSMRTSRPTGSTAEAHRDAEAALLAPVFHRGARLGMQVGVGDALLDGDGAVEDGAIATGGRQTRRGDAEPVVVASIAVEVRPRDDRVGRRLVLPDRALGRADRLGGALRERAEDVLDDEGRRQDAPAVEHRGQLVGETLLLAEAGRRCRSLARRAG